MLTPREHGCRVPAFVRVVRGVRRTVVRKQESYPDRAIQSLAYFQVKHHPIDGSCCSLVPARIADGLIDIPSGDQQSGLHKTSINGTSALMKTYSRIVGTGSYLPEKVVTNRDLEARIETTDEWIVSRTGIEARHVAAEGEMTSDLAVAAARQAMEAAGVSADDIDLIVVATTTEDMIFPSTACLVQAKLGVKQGAAFDVQAVCTGFIYALSIADKFVACGQHRCALVIGAEVFSRILDWNDRRTCVLFGDGAGAVVLKQSTEPGLMSSHLHADGSLAHILRVPGGISSGELRGSPFLEMDGQAVYRVAVTQLDACAKAALAHNGLTAADVDWFVPHQANIRIINTLAEKIGVPKEKVVTTVARQGNTSAASVPLALDAAVRDGRIKSGHLVLMEGVGGGMTWGAVVLRW